MVRSAVIVSRVDAHANSSGRSRLVTRTSNSISRRAIRKLKINEAPGRHGTAGA
jgi:hypothetical protein